MLSPEQFARVKSLFNQLREQAAKEQHVALEQLAEDPSVIATPSRF